MEYAHVVGAGFGFGLGFLNFIGTILFLVFLFWAFKAIFRGFRYAGGRGSGWSGRGPWGWHKHHHGGHDSDEAMSAARERLAQGDIDPEEYEAIKQGLAADRPSDSSDSSGYRGYGYRRTDSALALARMRFAKGEISAEEFEAVRKTLNG